MDRIVSPSFSNGPNETQPHSFLANAILSRTEGLKRLVKMFVNKELRASILNFSGFRLSDLIIGVG